LGAGLFKLRFVQGCCYTGVIMCTLESMNKNIELLWWNEWGVECYWKWK